MLWLYVTIFLLKIKRLHTFSWLFCSTHLRPACVTMSPLRRFLKLWESWTLRWITKKNTWLVFFHLKDMKVLKKKSFNVRTSCCNVKSFCQLLLLTAFSFPPHQYIWRWDLSRSRGKPQQREVNEEKKIRQSGVITLPTQTMNPITGKILQNHNTFVLFDPPPPLAI